MKIRGLHSGKFNGRWNVEEQKISTYDQYINAINRALTNDFDTFKSDRDYHQIVGCDSHGSKRAQLIADCIKKNYSWLVDDIDKFRVNDEYGNPPMAETGLGNFSPNTLLYILNVGHIKKYLGDLENKIIVEIGIGYGGQAVVIGQQWKFADYVMVDIPEAIKLTKKYMNFFPKHDIQYQTTETVESKSSDIVISNFAFTELDEAGMQFYYNNFFSRTNSFYIQNNVRGSMKEYMLKLFNNLFDVKIYNEDGLSEIIIGVKK